MIAWSAALGGTFLVTHFVMSHPPVRARLVQRLGDRGFQGVYSLVALASYVPWVAVWVTHRHAGPALWVLRSPAAVHGAELVAACGVALAVAGVVNPAPSSVTGPRGQLGVRGLSHVTRHPLNLGVAMLMAAHVAVNGWVGDLVFFGGHLALALLGPWHQDLRHRAARPEYAAFADATSFWPNPLGLARVGGRGAAALALGLVLAVALRYGHRWL